MKTDHARFGPSRLSLILSLSLSLILSLSLAGCTGDTVLSAYLETNRVKLDQPVSAEPRPTQFVIQSGQPARTIAENLANAGLITDARLFEAYVRVNGLASSLQAGAYQLSPSMTIPEIAQVLQRAVAPEIIVRVGEGWRLEQTADYLTQKTPLDGADYRQRAETGDLTGLDASTYDFLAERPSGASLEGYLYPDTYRLPAEGATAADLLGRQLDKFAEQVMPFWREAKAKDTTDLTLHQVLTLASIIEREAIADDERPMIVGVYLNRVARKMKLQADPTVQYAMGYQPDTKRWWKTPMNLDEYASANSPYNTYLYPGLPPGPIASPSLKSIQAVLEPAQHDYLFFVAEPGGTGRHAFARTYEEHLKNVERYRQGQ